jgi:hypothetical protein
MDTKISEYSYAYGVTSCGVKGSHMSEPEISVDWLSYTKSDCVSPCM